MSEKDFESSPEQAPAEQLSGKVVCDVDHWWVRAVDPHPWQATCVNPRPAQPQAPAPSLDARGRAIEAAERAWKARPPGALAMTVDLGVFADMLAVLRAAPSAPSDALRRFVLEKRQLCADKARLAVEPYERAGFQHEVEEYDAALAASPSVTREQEWRSPECNYQLREILTLAWDHVNPIAAKFRKDILAAREHFAPLPVPTAPKGPQR